MKKPEILLMPCCRPGGRAFLHLICILAFALLLFGAGIGMTAEKADEGQIELCPFFYKKGGLHRYGFIDRNGNVVVEPTFLRAWDFSKFGLAKVLLEDNPLQTWFVDSAGAASFNVSYEMHGDFENYGLASVFNGEKYGFIDTSGDLVIPFEYDSVQSYSSDGLCVVRKDGKSGVIDAKGETVIPFIYDGLIANGWSDGIAYMSVGEKCGLIDKTGRVVLEPRYDFLQIPINGSGLVAAFQDGKIGYIDHRGKEVIPPSFASGGMFSYGLAAASRVGEWGEDGNFHGGKYGYIDEKGEWAIEPQFDWASFFNESGMAPVQVGEKFGVIDRSGAFVAQPVFDHTRPGVGESETVYAELDGKEGWIDRTGTFYEQYEKFRNGLTLKVKDGAGGYYNAAGEIVLRMDIVDGKEIIKNRAGEVLYPSNKNN